MADYAVVQGGCWRLAFSACGVNVVASSVTQVFAAGLKSTIIEPGQLFDDPLKPEKRVLVDFAILLIGVILEIGGMLFFGQVYDCIVSLGATCPTDATVRFAWAFPLVIFGALMILLGRFTTVAGYVVMEVRRKPSLP